VGLGVAGLQHVRRPGPVVGDMSASREGPDFLGRGLWHKVTGEKRELLTTGGER
jgi:hypothetical protein